MWRDTLFKFNFILYVERYFFPSTLSFSISFERSVAFPTYNLNWRCLKPIITWFGLPFTTRFSINSMFFFFQIYWLFVIETNSEGGNWKCLSKLHERCGWNWRRKITRQFFWLFICSIFLFRMLWHRQRHSVWQCR